MEGTTSSKVPRRHLLPQVLLQVVKEVGVVSSPSCALVCSMPSSLPKVSVVVCWSLQVS
jgi:hypothetical protein